MSLPLDQYGVPGTDHTHGDRGLQATSSCVRKHGRMPICASGHQSLNAQVWHGGSPHPGRSRCQHAHAPCHGHDGCPTSPGRRSAGVERWLFWGLQRQSRQMRYGVVHAGCGLQARWFVAVAISRQDAMLATLATLARPLRRHGAQFASPARAEGLEWARSGDTQFPDTPDASIYHRKHWSVLSAPMRVLRLCEPEGNTTWSRCNINRLHTGGGLDAFGSIASASTNSATCVACLPDG